MKNQYVLFPVKLIGTKLLFVVLSVFFMLPFGWLIQLENGFFYYSILTSLLYIPSVYSDSYHLAIKDKKPYSVNRSYPHKGLVMGIIGEIPSVLILAALLSSLGNAGFRIANFIYIAWMAPFVGFLGLPIGGIIEMASVTPYYFAALLYVPVTCGLGYFAGTHKFSILEKYLPKIIHKSKKDTRKEY